MNKQLQLWMEEKVPKKYWDQSLSVFDEDESDGFVSKWFQEAFELGVKLKQDELIPVILDLRAQLAAHKDLVTNFGQHVHLQNPPRWWQFWR